MNAADRRSEAKPVILVPSAGLANRMRAVDSSIAVCRNIGRPLRIVWTRHHQVFPVRFEDLFLPLAKDGVELREARSADTLLYGHLPFRGARHLHRFLQRAVFGAGRMTVERSALLLSRAGKLPPVLDRRDRTVLLLCGCQMVPTVDRYSAFRPLPHLRRRIDEIANALPRPVLGVHVRRGDHAEAIRKSPVEAFVREIRLRLDRGEAETIFLASDSDEVKRELARLFGRRIVMQDAPTDRTTAAGMESAVVDLWTLSLCNAILGSGGSTFSETAAWMGSVMYANAKDPGPLPSFEIPLFGNYHSSTPRHPT